MISTIFPQLAHFCYIYIHHCESTK